MTVHRRLFLVASAQRTNLIAVGNAHGFRIQHTIPTLKGSNREGVTMAQTLVSLLVHVIFSTRNRQSLITPEIEPELFAYMGGILKNNASRLMDAGGTRDHVHLIISQSKNISLSSLMKDVKKDSSVWIKTKSAPLKDFHWQDGYGAFSVSKADLPGLKRYLSNQREHHRKRSFKEELIKFPG
jgi:REP element-mobilizing transposase RayT